MKRRQNLNRKSEAQLQLSKVFKEISRKIRKTEPTLKDRAIYQRIEKFQRKHNILTKRLAQNAYAYDAMKINVQRLGLNQEEKEELQKWLESKPKQAMKEFKEERKEAKIRKVRQKIVDEFSLPSTLANDANKMANIYQDLYVLENLVRHVVITVLSKKHGSDWWKNRSVVSKKVADKVEGRKQFEGENKWVAKRGSHEIFYTDFADLGKIIAANPREFRNVFADMEIEAELRKLKPSRNIIAHNNPLRSNEIKRIQLLLSELQEQLKNYAEKK